MKNFNIFFNLNIIVLKYMYRENVNSELIEEHAVERSAVIVPGHSVYGSLWASR